MTSKSPRRVAGGECARSSVVVSVVGIALYLVSRLALIDADPPKWALSHYQACDEGFYLNSAFFFLERHPLAREQLASYLLADGRHHTNWLLNVASAPGLFLVGRTYLGMRLGVVLIGLISCLATTSVVGRLLAEQRREAWGVGLSWAFLLVDFGVILSDRIVEPTATRMVAMTALVVFVGPRLERLSSTTRGIALVALLTGIAWVFTYTHNAFLAPAMLTATLWSRMRTRGAEPRLRVLASVSVGWAGGFAFVAVGYALTYWLVFRHNVGEELIFETHLNANRIASGNAGTFFRTIAYHVRLLLVGASFKLAPAMLLAWLLALPMATLAAFRATSVRGLEVVVVTTSWSILAQLVLVNDYPERKLVMCVPLALYTLASVAAHASEVTAYIRARRTRVAIAGAAIGVLPLLGLLTSLSASGRQMLGWTGPSALLAPKAIGLIGVVAVAGLLVHGANRFRKATIGSALVAFASAWASEAWVSANVVYRDATFHYRDMMHEIALKIGDAPLIGGTNVCTRLYLPGGTYLTPYGFYGREPQYRTMLAEALVQTDARYYLEYESDQCPLFCLPKELRAQLGLTPIMTFDVHEFDNSENERIYDRYVLFGRDPVPSAVKAPAGLPATGR